MYINQMISRIKEVEEMLKNVEMNSEDYAQLLWELSCWKREVEWRQDSEYVNKIAKYKADMMDEEISDRLIMKRS
jgi:hypothetical protein